MLIISIFFFTHNVFYSIKGRNNYLSSINSLPNDKISDWSKLKAFADNKIKILKMIIFVFDRVENIVGKGENAGCQHFLLFPQCFQKVSLSGSLKIVIVW